MKKEKKITYFSVCIHFWSNTARMSVMSIHAYSLISFTFIPRSFSFRFVRTTTINCIFCSLYRHPIEYRIWIFFLPFASISFSFTVYEYTSRQYLQSWSIWAWLELSLLPRESIHIYERLQNCLLAAVFFLLFSFFFAICLIRSNINILLSSRERYVNLPFFFLLLLLLAFVCMRSVLDVIHFTACYGLLINVRTRSNTLKMFARENMQQRWQ